VARRFATAVVVRGRVSCTMLWCPAREEAVRLQTALFAALLVACASATTTRAPRGDPDVLAAEEIERSNVGTLHEAIQRLRPHYFFSRGRTSLRGPNNPRPGVIVNNIPQNSFESLRAISANDVQYVRFHRAPEATTRFGTGYMAGAIEVVLK
jgi:hypothetical protein